MSSTALALTLSALTAVYILVLIVERRRGRRFGARMRGILDRALEGMRRSVGAHMPDINDRFFRQLFHYIIHLFLSSVIRVLEFLERGLRRIMRLNRKKAVTGVSASGAGGDSHLKKIAEHKEESALTEKEKTARKKAALRGDPPIKNS